MDRIKDGQIEEFVDAAHRTGKYGLLGYSSGNLSCRVQDGLALLSESRSWLAELHGHQVCLCRIEDGVCLNDKQPTVESVFHLGILRKREDVNVVLHFQSPYATAIACSEPANYNYFIIPEIPYYIGEIGIVEFLQPGSPELAEATIACMQNYNLAILCNHGLVTVGRDYNDAIQKAGFFELACQVLLTQTDPVFLPDKSVKAIMDSSDHV